ncbi:hypothetical protein CR513_04368, partial [Mucuna pruriens]
MIEKLVLALVTSAQQLCPYQSKPTTLSSRCCKSPTGGGHYGSMRTTQKVLDCRLYWPTIFRNAHTFVFACKQCQRAGMTIS